MGRLQLSFPIQLLLAGLAGALLAMSYSLQPFWWAAWLAPVPLIVAALAATRQRRRVICVLAGVIAGAATLSYHSVVGSWPTALLILVLRAAGWMWVLGVVVRAAERWRTAAAVFVLPMAWAGLETLIIHFSPHSSGGSLAYSQMDFLPVVQIASLGGVPAVVFVVLLFGSWAGFLVARFLGLAHLRGLPAASVAVALIVFGVLAFGFVRLREGADSPELKVALITTDGLRPPRDWASFWSVYGPEVQNAAQPGVVVVLPEAVVQLTNVEADVAAVELAKYAQAQGSTLVVGIVVTDDGAKTNRALVVEPSGAIFWYLKQHLVPGHEADMTPGKRTLVYDAPVVRTGVAICKDMHFPALGRAYAREGARLMLIPANDFEVDDWMSSRITALRGVEGGYAIARASRRGISSVSDRFGRLLAEQRSSTTISTMSAAVPVAPAGATVYARAGDVFGWACAAAVALMYPLLRYRGRRTSAGEVAPISS